MEHGGGVRGVVGANTLEGKACTLKVGFPGIAWTQFVTMQTYELRKVIPSADYSSWLFELRDAQILEKRTIYAHPENGQRLSEDNPWYLCGTPAEIFQAVTLFGLQLADTAIDRAGLVALDSPGEGIFAGWRPFQLAMTEPFEAKKFLEQEIFKPSGM